jgi:hypothetical protein
MGRLAEFDRAELASVLAKQQDIISRSQAIDCSMSVPALRYKTRPDGPWQVVLPTVYSAVSGTLTLSQRLVAAYLYAGRPVAITGLAAVRYHGIRTERTDFVDVLVPLDCRRADAGFARLHRSSMVPSPLFQDGAIRYVPPARAVADAARFLRTMPEIRSVVAAAVQQRKVEIAELTAELSLVSPRGTAGLRAALAEVVAGARSVAESDLMRLTKRAGLPAPIFNAQLFVDGRLLAIVDAWWPEAGVAVEVESREWHFAPADWERTLARSARLTAHGILVVHITPRKIRVAGAEVAQEIRAAIEAGKKRPPLQIVAKPS